MACTVPGPGSCRRRHVAWFRAVEKPDRIRSRACRGDLRGAALDTANLPGDTGSSVNLGRQASWSWPPRWRWPPGFQAAVITVAPGQPGENPPVSTWLPATAAHPQKRKDRPTHHRAQTSH